mmetsp:Transcript_22915/g.32916  ORF Transcript_22915/g.32916 Transcript_22915/m.32916 type:complete len:384 (+) Transcript_22915:46-1197(+)
MLPTTIPSSSNFASLIFIILSAKTFSCTVIDIFEPKIAVESSTILSYHTSSNKISVHISPNKSKFLSKVGNIALLDDALPHPYLMPTPSPNLLSTKPSFRPTPSKSPSLMNPTAFPSSTSTAVPSSPVEDISYHGGLIMTGTVNAYNIYYGNISSSTKNLMNYFAANLGNTSWYNTLTTYYQIVNGVKTSVSKSLVYKNSVDVTATKTMLRGSDVINIILTLFNAGKFPVDSNGVYTLFFRGDISALYEYETPALNWLVDFCGYHGAFRITNGPIIKFMVIGDPSYAGANGEQCEQIRFSDPGGTANNNLGADSMVSVYAHEMAETITNYNGAWYFNSNGNENGDACYWDFGDYSGNSNMVAGTKRFLVQQMWVPTKGCVMSL